MKGELGVILGLLVGILAAALMVDFKESKRPEFSLKKDDWVCTATHREWSASTKSSHDVCDDWHRIERR